MDIQYEKLKKILREMFQMDQADLDFGIYRIMNQKRGEIEQFLDKDLLPQVKSEFGKYKDVQADEKKNELKELEDALIKAKVDPNANEEVQKLRGQIASYGDEEAFAGEVFSSLATFFRRYYDGGDFMSLRRYKKDTYAIPYEGEEVKLHWANADQYYIKSSEYLKDYAFKISNGKRVHFKLVDATQEKDNVKEEQGKERRFKLHEEDPIRIDQDDLFIHFAYLPDKEKQEKLNENAIEFVKSKSSELKDYYDLYRRVSKGKDKQWMLLERQLSSYTARFNFDFFIHKDLGGFLKRELDFYVKNEVLFVDDLDAQDTQKLKISVAKVKVIKHIAHKIIDMLAQLEEFQKKLWLKKKFVTNCGYCVTLDKVPEELYEEIVKNDGQREEWIKLFCIDKIEGDLVKKGYSEPLTIEFLKENPFLVLDTKYFNHNFKENILRSIENIDEVCDGVIVNSENLQALQLIREKYQDRVSISYIDPPYNTASTPIIYKNDYKHSSWATLLHDRLLIAMKFLLKDGVKTVAIDDAEMVNLSKILSDICPDYRLSRITVVHNPKGSITKDFNRVHEYALFLTKEDEKKCIARTLEENDTPRKMRRWGENSLRTERRLSFYPIYVKDNKITRIGEVPDDDFHPEGRNIILKNGEIGIWPIDQDGVERRWNFGLDSINDNLQRITIQKVDETLDLFLTHELTVPKTVWAGGEYDAGNYGNTLLINMLGAKYFDFPKSINLVQRCIYLATAQKDRSIVLDYFAGSGTSAHATINLNREDDRNRKYILIEMGEYFNNVLKPRIQKAIYSKDWKDGKPISREGSSHMFKYLKLESYEDTLDNLIVKRSGEQQATLDTYNQAKENYMLHYWLDVETRGSDSLLNIDRFEDPFNYTLKIRQDNELKDQKIDLEETFNYLVGLYVKQTEIIRGFKIIRGKLRTAEKVLVIWRNTKEKSNDDLNEFFSKQGYNTLDFEFDRIYVNGDNNLENLRVDEDKWKVILIEDEFKKRMFDVQDL